MKTAQRTHTPPAVCSERPVRGGFPDPAVLSLRGLDQLRHVLDVGGPAPPMHYLTGLLPTEVEAGTCSVALPATPWLLSSHGLVPVGVVALLADSALGMAAQTALPGGTLYTTAEVSVDMLRRVAPDAGSLIARARNVHAGSSVVVGEVFVSDAQGRAVATGTSRCHLLPGFDVPAGAQLPPWTDPGYEGLHPYQRPTVGGTVALDDWLRMSGLEVFDAQRNGELPTPPLHALTGIRPLEWSDGACTFGAPASPWLAAPHGNVAGGAVCLLTDAAISGAISTTVDAGRGFAMLGVRVNFIRPVLADDSELIARGTVIRRGRTTGIATAEVTNAHGKVVAIASGTALMRDTPFCGEPLSDAKGTNHA